MAEYKYMASLYCKYMNIVYLSVELLTLKMLKSIFIFSQGLLEVDVQWYILIISLEFMAKIYRVNPTFLPKVMHTPKLCIGIISTLSDLLLFSDNESMPGMAVTVCLPALIRSGSTLK